MHGVILMGLVIFHPIVFAESFLDFIEEGTINNKQWTPINGDLPMQNYLDSKQVPECIRLRETASNLTNIYMIGTYALFLPTAGIMLKWIELYYCFCSDEEK